MRINLSFITRILTLFLFVSLVACSSQNELTKTETPIQRELPEVIWDSADLDVPPEIEGGNRALAKAVNYPSASKNMKESGTVLLQVTIFEDDSVADVVVLKSVTPRLDRAAKEAIGELNFVAGKKGGKKVACTYNVPISFHVR